MKNIKSGQRVLLEGITYLFLGYNDYKRNIGVIADEHGNKAQVFSEDLKLASK